MVTGLAAFPAPFPFPYGSTNTVLNTNDSGPGSLRDTVASATNWDAIVVFDPSLNGQTIRLESQIEIGIMTIDARSLPAGLTISGNGTNRIFNTTTGVWLYGLTITNGGGWSEWNPWGGAIYNGGVLIMEGCTLTGNTGYNGGAICNAPFGQGTLFMSNCVLSGNTALGEGKGGAIFNMGDVNVQMVNCLLTNNSAISLPEPNNRYGMGGAIWGGNLKMTNCTLSGNSAGNGGAIYSSAEFWLQDCTLAGNTATSGGAIHLDWWGGGTLVRCTLTGNRSLSTLGTNYSGGGGAIYIWYTNVLSLTHCTVAGNSSLGKGGGILGGSLRLTNTIVAGNTAVILEEAADLYKTFDCHFAGANIIGNQFRPIGAGIDTGPAALTNAPLLAPLGNYGGPTLTMALLPGSPARNAAVGSTSTNDQRGFPIVGPADIGAYEAGTTTNFNAWIWETLSSTNSVDHLPGADPDADGITNYDEWLALTDPAANSLRMTMTLSGTNAVIRFPTVSNRQYTLWTTEALSCGWTNSRWPGLQGNGSTMAFTNPVSPTAPHQFYKIQATP